MKFHDPYFPDADLLHTNPPKPPKAKVIWMLTMADLFSLMLTFFVLLCSMSTLQTQKWQRVSQSLHHELGNKSLIPAIHPDAVQNTQNVPHETLVQGRNVDYLYRIIDGQFSSQKDLKNVVVTLQDGHVVISLGNTPIFAPGSAELLPDAKHSLQNMAEILGRIDNSLEIVGYAGDEALQTPVYQSYWELSLARAVHVANALHDAGYLYGLAQTARTFTKNRPRKPQNLHQVDLIVRENLAKFSPSF